MLKSMTAYASLEETAERGLTVGIEVRTYNSRYLDVALRIPSGYTGLEEQIKSVIHAHLTRGRAEVRIWVKDTSETACSFEVDMAKAKAYHAAAWTLKNELAVDGELTLSDLLGIPGIMQKIENCEAAEQHWPLIERCLRQTLTTIDQMRRIEGDHIAADFDQRLAWMEAQLDQIENAVTGMFDHYREKLLARIEALTQGAVPIDPMRIAQEAAIIADRSDIAEEIVRARSHIAQFRAIMQGEEPAGRKLNFLLQEFNREFNTMGSKAGQAELAHMIVSVKAEIERLREQVQNIE
jgi:uncharacterized protein (TIGR00255 family)